MVINKKDQPCWTQEKVICDSSVGIALGYGLGVFLFTTAFRTASYPMGTGGSSPGDKAAGA